MASGWNAAGLGIGAGTRRFCYHIPAGSGPRVFQKVEPTEPELRTLLAQSPLRPTSRPPPASDCRRRRWRWASAMSPCSWPAAISTAWSSPEASRPMSCAARHGNASLSPT